MFCTRCQRTVPDFVWIKDDHPVLTDRPIIVNRRDDVERDIMVVQASVFVERRMCSDVYYVKRDAEKVEPKREDAKPHFSVTEDGKTEQNIPVVAHPYVPGYSKPST